ncbi:uncharacterized protein LOC126836397 [Adelges cooleyi]|uniref:uncharacterized protein LOC126836397 n=1 Tax=Adelges cooleyi TaxID=133065 RepID=UPI00217F92BF|nr:uncharacterized protein LOC126836397 [Adelges cooleyi]XP_050425705.1 uncharacterized protein LOC126836397 [Adelges cooleyi]
MVFLSRSFSTVHHMFILLHIVTVINSQSVCQAEGVFTTDYPSENTAEDPSKVQQHYSITDNENLEQKHTNDQPIQEKDRSVVYMHLSCHQNDKCDDDLEFKRPENIWGKEFNTSISKTLCEACVYPRGSIVDRVQFTKRGTCMCEKVCNRQDQITTRVPPTEATLKDSYCTKSHLRAAACVCMFKVTFQSNMHYVFIHFIPNRDGHVATQYYESGHALKVPL